MGAVTNLVVLALVGLATAWENLPNIPANRRAEYYLLHDDGAYKFGYDTGSGASHVAQADAANEVRGSYAYQSPEGPVTLVYTAGRGGFVPSLQSGSSSVSVQAAKSSSHGAANHYSASSSSQATSGADYDENADASYAFNIDTDEYKRDEASDAKGNVRGRYSYSGKDGNNVAVSYTAGAGKGFVIESHEGLNHAASPVSSYSAPAPIAPKFNSYAAPKVPIAKPYSGPLANIVSTGPNLDGSYAFSYQTPESDRQESSDASGLVKGRYSFVAGDGVRRTVDYNAGALLGFVAQGDGIVPPIPVAPQSYTPVATQSYIPVASAYTGSVSSSSHSFGGSQKDDLANSGDASYSFAYQADDHERKESSDPSGNVQGVYSYTAPDGNSRTVKYTAGANKGFVVEQSQAAVSSYQAPARHVASTLSAHQYSGATKQHAVNSAASTGNADASYSFGYQADTHARQESADAQGNVRGSYSFKADDGVSRQVNYEAGANKGFIAQGAHLPTPVVAPITPFSGKSTVSYLPPAPAAKTYVSSAPAAQAYVSSAPADGSYSFNYNVGDSSRQESADPSGYVRGHYSFTADDGVSRSVQYEAGAGKGFVAQGSHLPVAPVVATKTASVGSAAASSWSKTATPVSTYSAAAEKKGDSAYSYSYQTDSSSKKESSDANGNVVGTFTFVGGDGQSRTLNYVAGAESGFLASGAHLPVAPSAGSGVTVAKSSSSGGSSWNTGAVSSGNSWNSGVAASTGSWNSGSATAGGSSWSSKTVSTPSSSSSNFVLHKYLPPDSAHKFGYILDTRV